MGYNYSGRYTKISIAIMFAQFPAKTLLDAYFS